MKLLTPSALIAAALSTGFFASTAVGQPIIECPVTPAPGPSPSYHWDLPGTHDDDSCPPKGKECNGFPCYKVLSATDVNLSGGGSWQVFFEATPENCVLAPIGSEEELGELVAEVNAILGGTYNVWTGVYKSALDFTQGQGSRADWFNLDGTPAAICEASDWFPDEPDGDGRHLAIFSIDPDSGFDGLADSILSSRAVYKCCAPVVTFPSSCDDA